MNSSKLAYSDPSFELLESRAFSVLNTSTTPEEGWDLPELPFP